MFAFTILQNRYINQRNISLTIENKILISLKNIDILVLKSILHYKNIPRIKKNIFKLLHI